MSTARVVMRSIWRKASGKYALTVLGLWVLVSLVSLVWTPHTLLETDGFHAWASPSAAHPLGTDGVGADVLSWLMAGSRTNLAIALLTVAVSGIFGLALVAAMVSRNTVLRSTSVVVVDALISIPTVLIALMLSVPFGASAAVIVAACGFAYGLNLARIARPAAVLAARSQYVESAVWFGGLRAMRVFGQAYHAECDAGAAGAVVDERGNIDTGRAGLTYLGVGVGAGVPIGGIPSPHP